MGEPLTLVVLRNDGSAPRTLRLGWRTTLAAITIGAGVTAACLWAGWKIGALTAAM
ncbi:MAG: hypothetical protein PVI30_12595 [Myxococcales bacterium]|jgi:hypothetical protein